MKLQQGERTFYTLVITQALTTIGGLVSGLAIGIWIFNETGNATPFAIISFCQIVPRVIAYSFAGVVADRWDRRKVIILSDTGQAVGTLILLAIFVTNSFELWHLYAVTFFQSAASIFQGPAFAATIPTLVPAEKLIRANSYAQLSGPSAAIIAPIIAGLIYPVLGVVGAIAIDLTTFLLAIICVMMIRLPANPRSATTGRQSSFWEDFQSGFQFLWHHRPLLHLILIFSFVNMVASGFNVLSVPYIISRTNNEAVLGIIVGIASAGSLLGGIVMAIWGGTQKKINTVFPSIALMGIMLLFHGMSQHIFTMSISIFLALAAISFAGPPIQTLLQIKVPAELQGRVFATFGQLVTIMQPIGYLVFGPLADHIFEPAIDKPIWQWFAPLFGTSTGAGMGLLLAMCGAGITLIACIGYSISSIRTLEDTLANANLSVAENSPLDYSELSAEAI